MRWTMCSVLLPKKRNFDNRTASTKVTEAEFAELESLASRRSQNVSEWIRQTLPNEARCQRK